jgi:hypothetical protein
VEPRSAKVYLPTAEPTLGGHRGEEQDPYGGPSEVGHAVAIRPFVGQFPVGLSFTQPGAHRVGRNPFGHSVPR